jgi:prepilin-type N-terminal cleavage/methylation domain-containing protein
MARGPNPLRGPSGYSKGFSLIEVLIVVAIILITAAIAIPNLIRSRIAANEASAVANLRNITTAEVAYATTYGNAYSPDLLSLGGGGGGFVTCNAAGLIDDVLAQGQKSGYTFSYAGLNQLKAPAGGCAAAGYTNFQLRAAPVLPGSSGQRYFYTDETAVIRYNLNGPAGPNDPPI